MRQQYGFACGYCDLSETDAGSTLTVDHFHPRSQGGTDDFANLVYCCHACNEHKGEYWNPTNSERVLHPVNDDLATHFVEQSDGTLSFLTVTGQFYITRLHLNHPALVARRRIRAETREQDHWGEQLTLLREILHHVVAVSEAIRQSRSGGE